MLPVRELIVARAGIQRQEAAMVDDEVERIEVPMLCERAAAREQTVGVVRPGAAAEEHLSHVLEMAGLGQQVRNETRRRRVQVGPEKRIEEPTRGMRLARQHVLYGSGQGGGLRSFLPIEVANVGGMGGELLYRQAVRGVRGVAVAILQRSFRRGDPVPENIIDQPGAVRPIRRDVLSRAREPGVKVVLLGPGVGAEDVPQRRRCAAAVVAAGLPAMLQQFEVLGATPDQPLVDPLRLDPGPEARAAEKPQAIPHAIESRVVARQVLAVDGRFGPDHEVHHLDQSRQVVPPLRFGEVIVKPIPSQNGVNPAGGIPVHGFPLLVTGFVETHTVHQTLLRQCQVARIIRHQEHESRLGRFGAQVPGRAGLQSAGRGQQPVHLRPVFADTRPAPRPTRVPGPSARYPG